MKNQRGCRSKRPAKEDVPEFPRICLPHHILKAGIYLQAELMTKNVIIGNVVNQKNLRLEIPTTLLPNLTGVAKKLHKASNSFFWSNNRPCRCALRSMG